MQTVHTKNSAVASENQRLLPGLPVLLVSEFASSCGYPGLCSRNEWRDNCEMHCYLMNLTLQSEKQMILVLTFQTVLLTPLPCQVALRADLIS